MKFLIFYEYKFSTEFDNFTPKIVILDSGAYNVNGYITKGVENNEVYNDKEIK